MIHHDLATFPTRGDALEKIGTMPKASRRRMYEMRSGYYGGAYIIEWKRSDGSLRVMCADQRWHYIWSDSCSKLCQS